MKTKSRILSFVLAVVMLIMSLPLTAIPVIAADGTIPGAVSMSPIDGYSTTEVTLRGKITANGGSEIKRYGFQYGIVGGSKSETKEWSGHLTTGKEVEFELTGLQPNTTIWYYFYAVNSTGTAKDASDRDEVVNGTQYASTLPEIELDAPSISSPNEDDTFYAGEDITFKWGTVSDAEGFQWELYESSTNYLDKLIDDGSISGTTSSERKITIDGDIFKVGYSYKFKVRAYCDDVYSKWDSISIYIDVSPELIADVEELSFEADGGTDYIDLTSSHQWTATASKKWIHLSPDGGTSNKKITVRVDENTGEQRTGFITFESDIGSIIVNIHQHSGITPYLTVSTNRIELSSEDGGWSFDISSNVSWEIFCDSDWIRNISQEDGYGDESIQILANENTSTQSRIATITIEGDGITRTVTVTQNGRPAIVGDINNDGEITNKDRFLLNRYLANMAGYTDIDKTLADINGDGSVNATDAEYLSRHLAGWAGYEKLPEINTGTSSCAHTQYTDTYYNTVYVSDTIKTNTTHTYYHVYNRKCSCGVDIGKVQGELITEAHSYVNNLCACGAYNDASYEKWTGVNVSDAQANVYSTPSATVRYGYINKNEVVTVIGEYGDKYLIEYTLDGGNGVKQGYVVKSAITSLELVERENLIEEIEKTFFDPRSQYERYDDLAKDEISINFFDLMFADITDLGGVVEKCLNLGDADVVNSKHAIITLMDNMDNSVYINNVSECTNVITALYEWIDDTNIETIESMFEGTKNFANIISVITDIKSIKIDNINNELSHYIEYLFDLGFDEDLVMEKYAEILQYQLGNLDKKAAIKKVNKAANTFGNVVGGIANLLDGVTKTVDVLNAFNNIAIRDYTVELTKLKLLESIFDEYRYDHLLIAVREMKADMENTFGKFIAEAKKQAIDKAVDFIADKAGTLWLVISSAVEVTVGQDSMAKRDACYILEMEDAAYWYIKSLMYSYQETGDVAIIEKINKALHMYTDCKTTLNALAIELNTWGIFVTDKDKYDYLSIYKYWYSHQHDDIDTLFAEVGIK